MAVPKATALHSGAHETSYPYTDLAPTKNISLTGSATNGPILEWEWSIVPTDLNNAGGLPEASGLLSTTSGDFTNGKASVQNPSVNLDVEGGYNFQLRARNADGWSDPSYPSPAAPTADGTDCQAIVYILTPEGLKRPPANMYRYENNLNETLGDIEGRLGSLGASYTSIQQYIVPSDINTSDGTPKLIFEQDFEIPVYGIYRFRLDIQAWSTWVSIKNAYFHIIIDEGTADEITLGGTADWLVSITSSDIFLYTPSYTGLTPVDQGTHQVRVYAQNESSGGSYLRFFSADARTATTVTVDHVSGSGLGGTVTDLATMDVTWDETAGYTTWLDVLRDGSADPLAITFDTVEGEDVLITASGHWLATAGSGGDSWVDLGLNLDGTDGGSLVPVAQWRQKFGNWSTYTDCPFSLAYVFKNLSEGTHTITLQYYKNGGGLDLRFASTISLKLTRFRGGQIPIESDGTLVSSNPSALNYKGFGVSQQSDGTVDIRLPVAVTAQGVLVTLDDGIPSSAIDVGATETQVFPETGSKSFELPSGGLHAITVSGEMIAKSSNSSGQLKVVFDEGEANEQTIGYDESWQTNPTTSGYHQPTFRDTVTLTAGTHTLKIYGKRIDGSGTVSFRNMDFIQPMRVWIQPVYGSGAGGVLTDHKVLAADFVQSGDVNWHLIDNGGGDALELTFNTIEGEDVLALLNAYVTTAAAITIGGKLELDGTDVTEAVTFSRIDTGSYTQLSLAVPLLGLAAGSHTLKVYGQGLNTTQWTWNLDECSLSVLRFRGGLVPIKQSGTIKLDKPTALNFINAEVVEDNGEADIVFTPDTKSPKGTWATTTTVSFGARPGQPATTLLTLQDGKQRTMTTGTWDVANGVADWGYDEAASQGNSKWLYFYAVPKSGDDDSLVVRVSDNAPSTGPTGYTNFKLVWATYMESGATLRKVFQTGNEFNYANPHSPSGGFGGSGSADSAIQTYSMLNYIPRSSSFARLKAYIQVSAVGTWYFFVDGEEDVTSGTTRWNTCKATAGGNAANEVAHTCFEIQVENDQIGHFREVAYAEHRLDCEGWVDEWIDP